MDDAYAEARFRKAEYLSAEETSAFWSAYDGIEKLLGEKVYLDLQVSSRRDWQKNRAVMKELGYVLPKN